jgi:hypothetical protein
MILIITTELCVVNAFVNIFDQLYEYGLAKQIAAFSLQFKSKEAVLNTLYAAISEKCIQII